MDIAPMDMDGEQAFAIMIPWQQAPCGKRPGFCMPKGVRGSRGGSHGPKPLSRNERRGEAGFVVYCKCAKGFKQHRAELLQQQPWRKGQCSKCGALKPEWRCPIHKLLAEPLNDHENLSAGCPRCGRGPRPQRHDQYMTALARAGK